MIVVFAAILLVCSLSLSIFAFWIGRCARKLPVIDNNLPWTMSRGNDLRCTAGCKRAYASHFTTTTPECPDLRANEHQSS
jgi:hypothetical protein